MLLPAISIILWYIFSYFGLFHTDVESARFVLSTLIQSEAAIIALVITLSLVAVQLAASSYSARVIDMFRRTPDLWILIGIYSFAIFYGLGTLKLIEGNPQLNGMPNVRPSLEAHISFAYYLGLFAFSSLVPYIWSTLEMLKPSTVINMLAERITKQRILAAAEKASEDPILPIIDIANGALMRYDYETVIDGLMAIGERTSEIFKELGYTSGMFRRLEDGAFEEKRLSENIFDHLISIGRLAISRDNERAATAALYSLWANVRIAAEQKLEVATRWGIESMEEIGIAAAGKELEMPALTAVQLIGSIGESVAKQSREEPIFTKRLKDIATVAVAALEEIGKVAIEHRLDDIAQQIDDFLKKINEALSESYI
ncbi:MAG: DUF2254 domain-containing protein [Candidatus Methanoperedens sp.]|nr:DUF2254 domain-containing protein [Candidatus Methanoperedens sp.]